MKKILVLNHEYPPFGGGGGVIAKDIVEAMSLSSDISIDMVTMGGRELPVFEAVNERLSIWREGRRRNLERSTCIDHLSFLFRGLWRSLALTKNSGYSCVHCHFIIPSGLIGYIVKKARGISYVVSVHGSDALGYASRFKSIYSIFGFAWKIVLRNATAITVPHEHMLSHFDGSLRSKIVVIPHFTPHSARLLKKENFIVSSGRFISEKNFMDLIEAVSRIDLKDWRVKIAGDGRGKEELVSLARRLEVSGKVDFLGWLERDELSSLYSKASLFVAPSIKESFGLALLEGVSAGTYALARDIPSHRTIISDTRSGELFGSVDGLSGILKKYVTDGEPIPRVDPALALSAFDREEVIDSYKRLYACRS